MFKKKQAMKRGGKVKPVVKKRGGGSMKKKQVMKIRGGGSMMLGKKK